MNSLISLPVNRPGSLYFVGSGKCIRTTASSSTSAILVVDVVGCSDLTALGSSISLGSCCLDSVLYSILMSIRLKGVPSPEVRIKTF